VGSGGVNKVMHGGHVVFQTPNTKDYYRGDHIWYKTCNGWKCCLCGAVTSDPPAYPTDNRWLPDRYDKLTNKERELVKLELLM